MMILMAYVVAAAKLVSAASKGLISVLVIRSATAVRKD